MLTFFGILFLLLVINIILLLLSTKSAKTLDK